MLEQVKKSISTFEQMTTASQQLFDAASLDSAGLPAGTSNNEIVLDAETVLELQIIAQQIAGDLGLEIAIGEPGKGSFFSFTPPRITLDPIQVAQDPDLAKFIAGHEGAHRRFSPSPFDIMSCDAEVEELFSQPGFHATQNTIEDCAVNDGMSREVVGMQKYTTAYYAKAEKNGLQISTPEIEAITQRLGREPRFVKALSEMTRDWHLWRKEGGYEKPLVNLAREGRYAEDLEPSVLKCLLNTRRAVRMAISRMPKVGEWSDKKIKEIGRERFEIVRHKVYPEIQRLIEEDIKIEAIRNALNQEESKAGSKSKTNQEKLSDQISDRAKNDIEKANQEFQKEREEQQESSKQSMQEGMGTASKDETDNTEQGDAKSCVKLDEQSLAYDKLSQRTQRELEQAFDKLPKAEKEKLIEQAKELLEELEHEIVQALKPKLDPNPVETAHEKKRKEELSAKQQDLMQTRLENLAELQKELETERKASLKEFDRTYEDVACAVNEATNRLQRILIPEAFFKWCKDRQTGTRLNLSRALQSEADPRYLTKLFEQRLNPSRRTHAFEVLVDTSDSMRGEKIERTFDGAVFLAALCENLGVEFEIIEFNYDSTVQKRWNDSIRDSNVRDRIARVSNAKPAGTYDAPAVAKAYERLQEKEAMYKFIFVLTDAESNIGCELQSVLAAIDNAANVVVIHFGIGQGTADSSGYYKHSYGDLTPKVFFNKFCDVVEDIILNPDKYLQSQQDFKGGKR